MYCFIGLKWEGIMNKQIELVRNAGCHDVLKSYQDVVGLQEKRSNMRMFEKEKLLRIRHTYRVAMCQGKA